MDWKKITDDLYEKISPINGVLNSQIDSSFIREQRINSLWIEFDMNDFMYEDPFYGEQKSTAPFRMNVNPLDGENIFKIKHIQDLEGLLIEDSRTNLKGAFSNSLHFSAPVIKFGKIEGNKIEFEMEYCLTNSDSYGMMTGSLEDHIKSSGRIKIDLTIHDMLILVNKGRNVQNILNSMNPNIYDLKSAKEATDTNITYRNYNQYRVPYKELKYNKSKKELKNSNTKKKPWWKINFN